MKKLILIIFCMILVVSTVVTAFEFDDVKTYDKVKKEYTLTNAFGLGEEIARIKLNTPKNVQVEGGYNIVANFTITNGESDYDKIVNGIELYDIKNRMKEVIREVDYKYLTFIEVDDYKEVCDEEVSPNGTIIYSNCRKVKSGRKQQEKWLDFSGNSLIKDEVITIGLFTDVKAGDYVEWVINVYGNERLTAWATWNTSYDNVPQPDALSGSVTGGAGELIQVSTAMKLVSFTKHSSQTSTHCYLGTTKGGSELASTTFSGHICTFNVDLNASTNYSLTADSDGSNYNLYVKTSGGSKPTTTADGVLTWVTSLDPNGFTEIPERSYAIMSLVLDNVTIPDHSPIVTLNSPIDNYNSTSQTIVFNGTVSDDINLVNVSLYIDGVLNETNSSGINNSNYIFTKIIVDGSHNWTYSATDNASQTTTASYRDFNVNTTPHIQFENPTPVNEYNSTTNSFVANVSLTETYFNNLTFNIYNSSGLYDSTTYTDSTRHINWSGLADDKYSYNATVWTNTSQSNSTETRNITIDINPPEINITYPTAKVNYHVINTNLTINWTAIDITLDSCWYNYNGTNVSVTCADNTTQINITDYSNRNITFYANDTLGHEGSDYQEWVYKVFETSQTFSPTTIEGATEIFVATVTLGNGESIASVTLFYNGTSRSASEVSIINGSMFNLTSTFTIPSVTVDFNMSFFWIIDLISGQVNSSSDNQTVRNIGIDNCTTHSNVIFNYTMRDEEDQTKLVGTTDNTTLELDIDIFNSDKSILIINFSTSYNKTNPVAVCLSINLTEDTIYALDSIVKYQADDYAIEYYNIQNFELRNSSIPQNINLFDLLDDDSTEFQISFKGEDFVFVENALIFIDRQYVAEGVFKTVEIPKTDSNGQTIGHFVRNDVVYNIRVIKEGEVLGNFNNIIAFCEDYAIGNCQIVLEATPSALITFNYNEQLGIIFQSLPTYNNNTNAVSFSFSTNDGSIKTVSMEVTRNDIFGNRSICNSTLTSASGTLLCSVNPNIDDTVLVTSVYVENQLVVLSNVKLESSDYGNLGYVLWFFLTFFFILLFGKSKTEVLIGLVLSLTGAITLGITRGNIVGIGSAGIWMLVIVILGIWKINKENPQ